MFLRTLTALVTACFLSAVLLTLSSPACAYVDAASLESVIAASDAIVVARVEKITTRSDESREATAKVLETWKGPVRDSVRFLASPSWNCDVADAKQGELVVLFLERSDEGPVRSIAHAGRGRMPVEGSGRDQFVVPRALTLDTIPKNAPPAPGRNLETRISLALLRAHVADLVAATSAVSPATTLPVVVVAGVPFRADNESEPWRAGIPPGVTVDGDHSNAPRLRLAGSVAMDPSRDPAWCFHVYVGSGEHDVQSVTYLPSAPRQVSGFAGDGRQDWKKGLRGQPGRVSSAYRECSRFDEGDPLGAYRVEVLLDGKVAATFTMNVVAADARVP